jgi:cytochrome c553
MKKIYFMINFILITGSLFGQKNYNKYCMACHGENGIGNVASGIPPLANSEWVNADPALTASIILHGLNGQIKVAGKVFDGVMPAQGAMLSDDEISDLVNYISKNWGNNGGEISPDKVAELRKIKPDGFGWPSETLLEKYTVTSKQTAAADETPLDHLVTKVYYGEFKSPEDLADLKPDEMIEEEVDFISLSRRKQLTEPYAIKVKGNFVVKKAGILNFSSTVNGYFSFKVNDKVVTTLARGLGNIDAVNTPIELPSAGKYPFELVYIYNTEEWFKNDKKPRLSLGVSGSGIPKTIFLTKGGINDKIWDSNILKATEGKPRIYRNFINGLGARGIAVSFLEGVNYGYDVTTASLGLIWSSDFIDAGQHWSHRGKGFTQPLGDDLISLGNPPSIVSLDVDANAWPKTSLSEFKGYSLEKTTNAPVFKQWVDGVEISDYINQMPTEGKKAFKREISIPSNSSFESSTRMSIVVAEKINKISDNEYYLPNQKLTIIIDRGAETISILRFEDSDYLVANLGRLEEALFIQYTWE